MAVKHKIDIDRYSTALDAASLPTPPEFIDEILALSEEVDRGSIEAHQKFRDDLSEIIGKLLDQVQEAAEGSIDPKRLDALKRRGLESAMLRIEAVDTMYAEDAELAECFEHLLIVHDLSEATANLIGEMNVVVELGQPPRIPAATADQLYSLLESADLGAQHEGQPLGAYDLFEAYQQKATEVSEDKLRAYLAMHNLPLVHSESPVSEENETSGFVEHGDIVGHLDTGVDGPKIPVFFFGFKTNPFDLHNESLSLLMNSIEYMPEEEGSYAVIFHGSPMFQRGANGIALFGGWLYSVRNGGWTSFLLNGRGIEEFLAQSFCVPPEGLSDVELKQHAISNDRMEALVSWAHELDQVKKTMFKLPSEVQGEIRTLTVGGWEMIVSDAAMDVLDGALGEGHSIDEVLGQMDGAAYDIEEWPDLECSCENRPTDSEALSRCHVPVDLMESLCLYAPPGVPHETASAAEVYEAFDIITLCFEEEAPGLICQPPGDLISLIWSAYYRLQSFEVLCNEHELFQHFAYENSYPAFRVLGSCRLKTNDALQTVSVDLDDLDRRLQIYKSGNILVGIDANLEIPKAPRASRHQISKILKMISDGHPARNTYDMMYSADDIVQAGSENDLIWAIHALDTFALPTDAVGMYFSSGISTGDVNLGRIAEIFANYPPEWNEAEKCFLYPRDGKLAEEIYALGKEILATEDANPDSDRQILRNEARNIVIQDRYMGWALEKAIENRGDVMGIYNTLHDGAAQFLPNVTEHPETQGLMTLGVIARLQALFVRVRSNPSFAQKTQIDSLNQKEFHELVKVVAAYDILDNGSSPSFADGFEGAVLAALRR